MPSCATSTSSSRRRTSGSWTCRAVPSGRPGSSVDARTSHANASTGGPSEVRSAPAVDLGGRGRRGADRDLSPSCARLTDAVASALSRLGVGSGDRVAIFMPMAIETVAAVMACAKLGAVFVPIFSGFGPDAVAARIADAGCEVVDHRERLPTARRADADEADRRPGGRDRRIGPHDARVAPAARSRDADDGGPGPPLGGRGRPCAATAGRRRRARQRAPPVHRIHERHDGSSERGRPRARRVPREDRGGGRVPGRPASRRARSTG